VGVAVLAVHIIGGTVGAAITSSAGIIGFDPRAMDEMAVTNQYWSAHVTTTQWN